jgi:hypothetical protein
MVRTLENYWWSNWGKTFAYSPRRTYVVTSLEDIVAAVKQSDRVKAVGGGWSFTAASLPFGSPAETDAVSLDDHRTSSLPNQVPGQPGQKAFTGLGASIPVDVTPMLIDELADTAEDPGTQEDLATGPVYENGAFSYLPNPPRLAQMDHLHGADSQGAPLVDHVRDALTRRLADIIDTRLLLSSLQQDFPAIASANARPEAGNVYFHVEAGITIADLDQLLDHQRPRLALRSSGGSPGASLAGTLATATHGGEFADDLLIDTVRAIHLVAAGGAQWWIEGSKPVADRQKLRERYPELADDHIVAGDWSRDGLVPEDVLSAAIVSLGAIGAIYSVVLEVVPQFGIAQTIAKTQWPALLAAAGVTSDQLTEGSVEANLKVLDALLDGQKNGTHIARSTNRYADLAINPLNGDAWITNRERLPELPIDGRGRSPSALDYLDDITAALAAGSTHTDDIFHDKLVGRILDFLALKRDRIGIACDDGREIQALVNWLGRWKGGGLTPFLAAIAAQVNAPASGDIDPGFRFRVIADFLSAILDVIQGTSPNTVVVKSANVSYRLGAIGWPDNGVAGTAVEIALDPTRAFTFLQTQILAGDFFEQLCSPRQEGDGSDDPLLGYVSVRVCPPTKSLMGMQQFAPQSVMIEIVGYRTPHSRDAMRQLQRTVIDLNAREGLNAMLHWGLQNSELTRDALAKTPLGAQVGGDGPHADDTRLARFRRVRTLLAGGAASPFENAFVTSLGL